MCGDYTHRTVLDKIQSYNDCHGPKSQKYSKRTTKIRQHGFIVSYWTSESVFLFQEVFCYCLPEMKEWIRGEGQLCTDPRLMFLSEIFYWLLLETGYWSRQPVVWPSGFLEVLSLYLEECYCKCLRLFLWFHLSAFYFLFLMRCSLSV